MDWNTTLPLNTECKYLLLAHAFEKFGCIRVRLETDLINLRSQKAIERIGARRERILRNRRRPSIRRVRDSVFHSIFVFRMEGCKEVFGGDDVPLEDHLMVMGSL